MISRFVASSGFLSTKRPWSSVFPFKGRSFSSDYHDGEPDDVRQKVALVLGSSGCLGNAIVSHLGGDLGMKVIGADIVEMVNKQEQSKLGAFVQMPSFSQAAAIADMTEALVKGVARVLEDHDEIDVIVCASGGFMADPKLPSPSVSDEEFSAAIHEYGSTLNKMMEMNLYPVLAANYAANRFMAHQGLFVAIGATPALSPTPGILAYGLSKVGTHHFIQTLGEITGNAMTTKSRRQKARRLRKNNEYLETLSVVGILPTTIDTPMNRKAMPDANFGDWTKPSEIAKEIGEWVKQPRLRPHSGSLVKVHPSRERGATFVLAG